MRRAIAVIDGLREEMPHASHEIEPKRYPIYQQLVASLEDVDIEGVREQFARLAELKYGTFTMGCDHHPPSTAIGAYLDLLDAIEGTRASSDVLSTADAAAKFRVTPDTIANWARGRGAPPPDFTIDRVRRGYYRVSRA